MGNIFSNIFWSSLFLKSCTAVVKKTCTSCYANVFLRISDSQVILHMTDSLQWVLLNTIFQYFIRSPLEEIRDKHLFFIDVTQFFTTLTPIFSNSSAKKTSRSSKFFGFFFSTSCLTIDQMFSIGFTPGLLDDHCNKSGTLFLMNSLQMLLQCLGSLSCWRRQLW